MQRCLGPLQPALPQHTASHQNCCPCLRRQGACSAAALAAAHGLSHPLLPTQHAEAMLSSVVLGAAMMQDAGVVRFQPKIILSAGLQVGMHCALMQPCLGKCWVSQV